MSMKFQETITAAIRRPRQACARLLPVALLLAIAPVARAAAQEVSATPAPVSTTVAVSTPTKTKTPTPEATFDLGQALRAAVEECRARIHDLSAAAKVADPQDAAALRAEAVAVRQALKRRLLEIQLDYAQRSDDAALVDELTGILRRLDQPAVGVPQDRPAPVQTPQTAPAAR